jgi:hypothetical protein
VDVETDEAQWLIHAELAEIRGDNAGPVLHDQSPWQ